MVAQGDAPLAPPAVAAPVAERRLCSVLFVDLVGFTPLSETRDAEEVRELLTRYFEMTRVVIGRYGGTVEKFIGDAVMAVWGAPVVAEGDAERAVRAALEVVDGVAALGEQVGVPLAARGGVVTGEVAVTIGAEGQGMVAGDAVNTAARVQSSATAGTVLVDAATRRAAAAAIAFEDAGTHTLKGKAEPEQLWRPTRVLAGVGGSQRVDGLEAPLIGRDAELRTVKELFHSAIDRRTSRLLVVTGPAGVGKSRLGWDYEKYVDGLAIETWWHRGRCLSYGEGVSYWALAQAIRARLAIAEDDAPEVAAAKLADGLDVLVADETDRKFIAVRLGRLLGVEVPGDPGVALPQEDLFAGWRLFFERLAATEPVTWLIEDAQHADEGLLAFIDHLVDWTRELPIFVLVFGRDELTREHPGFGVGRNRSLLALDPLDPASMDRLVDALVPGMPAAVRATVTGQAQGIPLYAVETIRSLIDRDVVQPIEGVYRLVGDIGELAVPDSLHGLLAARLDALPTAVRTLAADAAVLGTSFPAEALVAVSTLDEAGVRNGLSELVRREVLQVSADQLSPERGSYRFSQDLLRQVAYDTLSRRDRKARHLRVAAHLRGTFADDAEEVADVVARHYRDALDAVSDDADNDEIRSQVIEMSVRSAERANRTGAPRAARAAYAIAAAQAEIAHLPRAGEWWERAAQAGYVAGDFELSAADAERAQQVYQSSGDARAAARAQAKAAKALRPAGRFADARERFDEALAVLRQAPDADTVEALIERTTLEVFANGEAAPAMVTEALELAQALGVDATLWSSILLNAGVSQLFRSQIMVGAALLRDAVRLAAENGDTYNETRALLNLADALSSFDPASAVAAGKRAIELSRQSNLRNMLAFGINNSADVLIASGAWDEADELLRQAVEDDELDGEPVVHVMRAVLACLRGDLEAVARCQAGVTVSADSEDPQDLMMGRIITTTAAFANQEMTDALKNGATIAFETARSYGFADYVRWAWSFAVQAAQELDDRGALEDLLSLVESIPVGHVPPMIHGQVWSARALLAEHTDPEAARRLHDQAVETLRQVPAPYHLALALMARHHGDDLAEAADIARRLGATPLLSRLSSLTSTV